MEIQLLEAEMKGARPLTGPEVQAVLEALSGPFQARDRALLILGIRSGFRISELLAIKVGDIWLDGKTRQRVTVRRGNMKGRREGRSVILHPEAAQAVQDWIEKAQPRYCSDEEAPLFPSRKGPSPLSRAGAWRNLTNAFKAAGLDYPGGTHVCRKTFAARVYELLGHDLIMTAAAMGHKSVSSTQSYLGVDQSAVDAAVLACASPKINHAASCQV